MIPRKLNSVKVISNLRNVPPEIPLDDKTAHKDSFLTGIPLSRRTFLQWTFPRQLVPQRQIPDGQLTEEQHPERTILRNDISLTDDSLHGNSPNGYFPNGDISPNHVFHFRTKKVIDMN